MPRSLRLLACAALLPATDPPPVRDRWVPVARDVSLHVRDAGRGPCVLLQTGWTIPIDIWRPTIEALATAHHVVAVEPRGQGRSSPAGDGLTPHGRARDLETVMARLGLTQCVVVGWSLGALDVIALAQRAPSRVAAVVLMDQPVHADTSDAANRAVIRAAARLQTGFDDEVRTFVRGMFRRPVAQATLDSIVRGVRRTTPAAAIAMMIGEVTTPLADALVALPQPVLVLAPSGSSSRADFEWMAAHTRRGTLVWVDSTGHAMMRDQPQVVAGQLARVAADHRPPPRP